MNEVTGSLRSHPYVDLDKWYKNFSETCGGMIGFGRYILPTEDDQRTALLYQFLVAVVESKINFQNFCMHAYGKTNFQEMVHAMNSEIVGKFTRQVSYWLREIETDLGDRNEVDSSALMVFNYHGPVQNIRGGVYGGIVAANSNVSGNNLIFNDSNQLARAVKDLSANLDDVLGGHRESVSGAFALLVQAIETNMVPNPVEIATAIQTIQDGSPSGLQRLRGIFDNAAGSLLGEALKPVLAYYIRSQSG